ncbi:MAG: response regulator [Rhodospirillaceae bacterium]
MVEDSRSDAYVIRRLLSMSAEAQYEISLVECLSEALTRLDRSRFDLILLDLTLPDSEGLSTLTKIVAAVPLIPIVVLTGYDDDGIGIGCIGAGAQDYLCKTEMTPDNLHTIVSFTLRRSREIQARLLRQVTQSDFALTSAHVALPVTRGLAGAPLIREREPVVFASLHAEYQTLLQLYMDHLNKKTARPKVNMEVLATQFGDFGATPRDIVDVHSASLDVIRKSLDKSFAYTFAADSRLFALEMMGLLVDYYRTGFRRLFAGGGPR